MLRKRCYVTALCAALTGCYAPKRDCASFKTGDFTFEYSVGDTLKKGRFVRSETYSIDYYNGQIDSATVRWINDCEFILKDINSKTAIHYKIIATTNNSYTFEYRNAVRNPNKKQIVKKGTAYKNQN